MLARTSHRKIEKKVNFNIIFVSVLLNLSRMYFRITVQFFIAFSINVRIHFLKHKILKYIEEKKTGPIETRIIFCIFLNPPFLSFLKKGLVLWFKMFILSKCVESHLGNIGRKHGMGTGVELWVPYSLPHSHFLTVYLWFMLEHEETTGLGFWRPTHV